MPVASESIGVTWLCSPWRAASFLWVSTIKHKILYSGFSTDITLPQLKFSLADFVGLELHPFRIIVLCFQGSEWCN